MKYFLSYILKGLLLGIGFGIAVIGMIYTYENYTNKPKGDFLDNNKVEQTEYLKTIIAAIDRKGPDLCLDIAGVWVGSIEEDDGKLIREFTSHYKPNGEFEGKQIFKTIANDEIQLQKGTWECKHSVLYNKVYIHGQLRYYNYLLFYNDNGERVYATIGRYSLPSIYTVTRRE